MQNWTDTSEIVTGMVIEGKYSPNAIEHHLLIKPYSEIIKFIQKNDDWETEDLIMTFGTAPLLAATTALKSLNGMGERTDWGSLLRKSYNMHVIGGQLESSGKKLQRGVEIDIPFTLKTIGELTNGKGDLIKASDVTPSDVSLVKTGWKPLDLHIGGLPEVGLTTIAAPAKTGKTSWLCKVVGCFLREHQDKNVVVITKEMINSQFMMRFMEVNPDATQQELRRLYLAHSVHSMAEAAAKASTVDDIGLIGIDFADLLISGEVNPARMEEVYRISQNLAIDVEIPVVLLAQLSRNYQGGIPRPFHIRWTAMAEALSWLLMTLYAPSRDYFAGNTDKDLLPVDYGQAYVIPWMCRSKTKKELPGAIQLPWVGETGWCGKSRGKWYRLDKANRRKEENDEEDIAF
jgi:hypothetical protein